MALTATAALPAELALATAACSGASAAPTGPGPRPRLAERLVDALGDASSRRVPVSGDRTAGRARVALLHATPRLPGDGASAAALPPLPRSGCVPRRRAETCQAARRRPSRRGPSPRASAKAISITGQTAYALTPPAMTVRRITPSAPPTPPPSRPTPGSRQSSPDSGTPAAAACGRWAAAGACCSARPARAAGRTYSRRSWCEEAPWCVLPARQVAGRTSRNARSTGRRESRAIG